MAKIKSFTSLEQSKKLAEFLPLESADMGWNVFVDGSIRCLPIDDWDLSKNGEGGTEFIPCWSLTALLDIIPKMLNDKTRLIETYAEIWIAGYKKDPVGACVKTIIKLHELNLL